MDLTEKEHEAIKAKIEGNGGMPLKEAIKLAEEARRLARLQIATSGSSAGMSFQREAGSALNEAKDCFERYQEGGASPEEDADFCLRLPSAVLWHCVRCFSFSAQSAPRKDEIMALLG